MSFKEKIYQDLDQKLRDSKWNSGASEAHGILCGLVCRGISNREIEDKMYLFGMIDVSSMEIIRGLFSLSLRDLSSKEFIFDLMLPDDTFPIGERVEEISNWCQGFLHGVYHDGNNINNRTDSISEIVMDIFKISHLMIVTNEVTKKVIESDHEIYVVEIREYLRVCVQLIYDELYAENTEEACNHH